MRRFKNKNASHTTVYLISSILTARLDRGVTEAENKRLDVDSDTHAVLIRKMVGPPR